MDMKKIGIIGSFVVDLTARTERLPRPGETVKGLSFRAGAGGKGSNQAIAAARQGAKLRFSTKIGNDSFSSFCRDAIGNEKNIDASWVFTTDEAETGTALISVSEETGQNEIVVVPGASCTYSDEDIKALDSMLDGLDYLLMQLEINNDATEKLIRKAYGMGIKVILNPAPAYQIAKDLYPMLYLVTPNETEAALLSGMKCTNEDEERAIASYFASLGVKNTIITIGRNGIFFSGEGTERRIPNYDLRPVDTTGAGDAFNGGLLAYLGEGMTLLEAARHAMAVSNISVTRHGTSASMPSREDVDELIGKYGLL